jgi:hypothetical protein
MAERAISVNSFDIGAHHDRIRLLALGSLIGVVAGLGTFMFLNPQFLPWGISETVPLALIGVAGAYTHFFAEDLSEGISLSVIAVVIAIVIHVVAWIAPLWILSYPPFARDLLLPQMVGEALASGIPTCLIAFYGVYFSVVLVGGYVKP